MFKLFDGRDSFYQWDLDRKLIVYDPMITEVHLCKAGDENALVVEVYEESGLRLANVPNILLQTNLPIRVYGYFDNHFTRSCEVFEVIARPKPADYPYVEPESGGGEEDAEYEHCIKIEGDFDPWGDGEYTDEARVTFALISDSGESMDLYKIADGEYAASGTYYNGSYGETYDVTRVRIQHAWDSDEHEIVFCFSDGNERLIFIANVNDSTSDTVREIVTDLHRYSVEITYQYYNGDGYEDSADIKTLLYLNTNKSTITVADFPKYCPAFGTLHIGDMSMDCTVIGLSKSGTNLDAHFIGGEAYSYGYNQQWLGDNYTITVKSIEAV